MTQAFVENANVSAGAVHVHADSNNTVLGIAASGSGAKEGAAVAGGVTLSIFHQKTYAFVGDDADVTAADLSVRADNTNSVVPITGALAVSLDGSLSVGANVALLFADTDVRAWIGAPDDVFSPTDDDTVDGNVIHLGYEHGLKTGEAVVYHSGGGASISGLIDGQTYYVIVRDDDSIMLAETRDDALHFQAIALDGSVATGMQHLVERVPGTTIIATGDIEVFASNVTEVVAVAGSLSIATDGFGAAGSGVSINLDTGVAAFIAYGTQVSADGSIYLDAADDTEVVIVAGAAGGGTTAGVGLSLANLNLDRTVRAYIGDDAVVTADGGGTGILDPGGSGFGGLGLTIDATAKDEILLFAAGVGVGTDTAAVAASVVVGTDNSTVEAFIGASTVVNGDTSGASTDQSVRVRANHDSSVLSVAGSFAGASAFGVGAAVNVEVLDRTVLAHIGQDATVNARQDIAVQAELTESVLSIAGGTALTLDDGASVGAASLDQHCYEHRPGHDRRRCNRHLGDR